MHGFRRRCMDEVKIMIIGAGIIGLAVATGFLRSYNDMLSWLIVVDKDLLLVSTLVSLSSH